MKKPADGKLQGQFEAAKACMERLCPPEEGTRRAAVVSSTVRALADYRAYLSDLERAGGSATGCGGLGGQLSERAFAAEAQLRVLLAEGLNSLNDLRDSGMLRVGMAQFAQAVDGGQFDFRATAQESVKQMQQLFDLPEVFAEELRRTIERSPVTASYDRKSGMLVLRSGDGDRSNESRVRVAPRPGDVARISLEHFFGGQGHFSLQPLPPTERADCHRRANEIQALPSIDAYTSMLGVMASAREAMYEHARKVSQYGHGTAVRAQDPIVVAFVVAGVALTVAIVSFVYAAVTGGAPFFTFGGGGVSIPFLIGAVAAAGFLISLEVAILLLLTL